MKVELRYPQGMIVGASGLKLFVNGVFIPLVKEIKIKPPKEDVKRTMLGYEIDCIGIELMDDGGGLIATIIKEGE